MDDNKKNIKLIVFKDDNDKAKDKDAIIYEKDEFGIKIQFYNIDTNKTYGASFFLPWHRVLKIKDKEEVENGN